MQQSNTRLFVTLALKPQPNRKRPYKPKPLKSLSTRMLWILIESIESQLKNSLFYSRATLKALEKRHRDLSAELEERLEYENWLCSINPFYERDNRTMQIVVNEIEALRQEELNPPRKSLCRSYVKGKRVRPGKKTSFLYKPSWKS